MLLRWSLWPELQEPLPWFGTESVQPNEELGGFDVLRFSMIHGVLVCLDKAKVNLPQQRWKILKNPINTELWSYFLYIDRNTSFPHSLIIYVHSRFQVGNKRDDLISGSCLCWTPCLMEYGQHPQHLISSTWRLAFQGKAQAKFARNSQFATLSGDWW